MPRWLVASVSSCPGVTPGDSQELWRTLDQHTGDYLLPDPRCYGLIGTDFALLYLFVLFIYLFLG